MTRAFFAAQRLRSAPLGSLALAKKSPSPSLLQNAARRSRREMRLICRTVPGQALLRFFRDETGEHTARVPPPPPPSPPPSSRGEPSRVDSRSRARYLRSRAGARERAFANAVACGFDVTRICVRASIRLYVHIYVCACTCCCFPYAARRQW